MAMCRRQAHRAIIVRLLKGLEDIIEAYQVHPELGPDGWYFSGEAGSLPKDPLHDFTKLRQLYQMVDPDYTGRVTVPVLWDKKNDTMVNNESSEIIRMLYTEFDEFLPEHLREVNKPGGGLYPEHLREDIDAMNSWVYDTVNNGVYKVGFAKSQEAYDANISPLFASLDRLEQHLASRGTPYLFGDHITEADVRLYTTMARFDTAYVTIFLCNLKTIRNDYPHLHRWLRQLYWAGSERGVDPEGKAWADEKSPGSLRGAFYRTTQPNSGRYKLGYAQARNKTVFDGSALPIILPMGPEKPILPL